MEEEGLVDAVGDKFGEDEADEAAEQTGELLAEPSDRLLLAWTLKELFILYDLMPD